MNAVDDGTVSYQETDKYKDFKYRASYAIKMKYV